MNSIKKFGLEIFKTDYSKIQIKIQLDIANEYLDKPIPELLYKEYRKFQETGNRVDYEDVYFERRRRLNALAIASIYTKEEKYIKELENIIFAICNEFTWCLPAHVAYSECVENQINSLDLFASETGFALSEIVYNLSDVLSTFIIERVTYEVTRRVLDSFEKTPKGWEKAENNWSAVCACGVGASFLYIAPQRFTAEIRNRIFSAFETFLKGFAEDGVCEEGVGYWGYGFGFYVYFADLIKQFDGTNMLNSDKIKSIATFPQKVFFEGDACVNFSDCSEHNKLRLGFMQYLHDIFSDVILPDGDLSINPNDNCNRWATCIRSFAWTENITIPVHKSKSLDWEYLPNAQWYINKKNPLMLATKGGHNDEAHNHNDVGSFILYSGGNRFITDLGSGEYTKEYFGKNRYSIFCNGSQGHSVPIINGEYQKTGRQFKSTVISATENEFSLDISKSYDIETIDKLIRNFVIANDAITLTDSYSFNEPPTSVTERFISPFEPNVESDKLILCADNKTLDIFYDAQKMKANVSSEDYVEHSGKLVRVYKIDFEVIDVNKEFCCEFKFVLR